MWRFGLLAGAVSLSALGVGACGGSSSAATSASTTGAAAPPAASTTIVIKDFMFAPMSLTVSPGAMVSVHNEDSATHTLSGSGAATGKFNTGDISPGTTKTFTAPATPGTYTYICNIHQFMMGTIVVK